jgi:hypothetical protein
MSSDSDSSGEELVTKPGPHDVLCGRGRGFHDHAGNIKFRQMVNEHKLRYLSVGRLEKPKVAREVVQLWRAQVPRGRFLARKDDSRKGTGSVKAEGNIWFDIGDKKATWKTSQCLREPIPDAFPLAREMQRQQDFLRVPIPDALPFVREMQRLQDYLREPVPDAFPFVREMQRHAFPFVREMQRQEDLLAGIWSSRL